MEGYNIEDLIGGTIYEGEIENTCAQSAPTTNKKTMNLFEQRKFDKFADSGRVDEIEANISSAEEKQILIMNIANSFDNVVNLIEGDKTMLNHAVEAADINGIETYAAELETKLDVVADKEFVKALDVLASIFGIEAKTTKKGDKAAAKKAMGFVTKNTKK